MKKKKKKLGTLSRIKTALSGFANKWKKEEIVSNSTGKQAGKEPLGKICTEG